MNELIRQLQDYAQGMWRYRYHALITAWAICLGGWLVVLSLPPVYQASARVYVDTTAVLKPLLEGIAVQQDVQAQLAYVRQAMLSRPQLEKVARDTDLDLAAVTPEQKEGMLDRLAANIRIESAGNRDAKRDQSSLFTITVDGQDPKKTLNVVRALVNSFVEDTLGGKRTGSDTAQRFLKEQISEYEQRLGEAEARLADFKKQNLGLMPGVQGDYFTRLQGETDAAQRVDAQLRVANQRRAELGRQLSGERPFAGASAMSSPTMMAMTTQIAGAQRTLDDLMLRYTEKHPDVIAARETLVQLQARQAAELAAMQSGRASVESLASMGSNPVYQQIQLQMNQVDVEIASLRSELGVRQQKIGQLRSMLDTAPEVEAEFARLNRDYDINKARYNELVNRLDRAQISEEAEQTGVVRFEVIDPPSVRLEPVAPDRPRLLTLVLFGGLLAGLGIALLGHLLRPTFTSARSVVDVTGLPVLGAVARTWVERYRALQRTQLLKLGAATGALVLLFAVVLAFQDSGAHVLQTLISRA